MISYSRSKSFLLLGQSGTFRKLEPRCHLWESQDLSVNEWEEMAEELTQHASHSITHLSCIWVKYQSLFSLRGFDQHPRFETDSEWKVFRSISPPASQWKQGLLWPQLSCLLEQLLRWSGPSAGFSTCLDFRWSLSAVIPAAKKCVCFVFPEFIEVCQSVSSFGSVTWSG